MAIQIIDPKPHYSVVKEVVCRNCGVKLAYTPSDILKRYVRDYGGGGDTYCWIPCPSCSKDVNVKEY